MTIFVPNQVALVDEANKVGNLAIVMTASAIAAVVIHPLVGAWSDRTRSRMGRRAPWILAGAGAGALFMMLLVAMNTLLWITVVWVLLMLALTALGTSAPAAVTDHFPRERRGGASAVIGMGTIPGMGIGVVGAGVFVEDIGVGYTAFAAGTFLVAVAYVLLNRDGSSLGLTLPPFSWKRFLGRRTPSRWTAGCTRSPSCWAGTTTRTTGWHRGHIGSDRVDLVFTPFYDRVAAMNFLVVASRTHQCFGHYPGWLVDDAGTRIRVENVVGWAEDVHNPW